MDPADVGVGSHEVFARRVRGCESLMGGRFVGRGFELCVFVRTVCFSSLSFVGVMQGRFEVGSQF